MSLSEGLLHICFNNQARRFGGDVAVSAMTILFSLFQFILLPVEGVSQGSQPIISYNYGAKLYHRVRQTVRIAVLCNLTFTVVATAFILIFPGAFIRIFNSDPELLAEPISDLLTTVTNALYFRRFLRQKLPAETELENPNGGILYDRT